MAKPEVAQPLKGWVTTTDAGKMLGVSRQSANKMVHEGVFRTLATIGDKPLYVVRTAEVEKLLALRTLVREAREQAKT